MENLLNHRIPLAHLPTPVQKMHRISKELGIELYVKRDDLTESVASGNKLRKLEYLLWDAKNKGADMLISCGGLQSNHCRAVAWAAAHEGMNCLLLLRGAQPSILEGNLLMDRLLGSDVRYYSPEVFARINSIAKDLCDDLKKEGHNPYYIPMGGSNAIGTLGYVRMVAEILHEERKYDHLYCALGSGGTFAGIWLGRRLYGLQAAVHGIAVCDDTAYFVAELRRIKDEFKQCFDLETNFDGVDLAMDDRHVGLGYAQNTPDEWRDLIRMARADGLVLDPVYTLKAFLGMMTHIKETRIKPEQRVLFIHTGGHYGIFPKHHELEKIL